MLLFATIMHGCPLALRTHKLCCVSDLSEALRQIGIDKSGYKGCGRKERAFGELLTGVLNGVVEIHSQYRVGPYFIDWYIPSKKVAIEYDELAHAHKVDEDQTRQDFITKQTGARFIRVPQGSEVLGLNQIIRCLV